MYSGCFEITMDLKFKKRFYEHKRGSIIEKNNVKILCDFKIQCGHVIESSKPAIINKTIYSRQM